MLKSALSVELECSGGDASDSREKPELKVGSVYCRQHTSLQGVSLDGAVSGWRGWSGANVRAAAGCAVLCKRGAKADARREQRKLDGEWQGAVRGCALP